MKEKKWTLGEVESALGRAAEKASCGEGGLTLEKIQKAKEIMDKHAVPPEEQWVEAPDGVHLQCGISPNMEYFKQDIAGSLSLDEQQELYEFMHDKLGLRIYK